MITEDIMAIIMTTLLLFGIPSWMYVFRRAARLERKEIRQQYMELVKEKLDVIRTALAMGKDGDEIADLDERLEKLIGTEKMLETLKKPTGDALHEAEYLAAKDIVEELDKESTTAKKELDS